MTVALWPLSAQCMNKLFSRIIARQEMCYQMTLINRSGYVWRKTRHPAGNSAKAFDIDGDRI
jgi:hypothetical protein